MVSEYNFEKDFVVKYFIDELKYEQEEPSIFNSQFMLIPSVVERFIFENNTQQCKEIIRNEFQGNAKNFFKELCKELSEYLYSSYNITIQLHPKKYGGFKFLDKYFLNLYLPFNHSSQDKNIYTIIQQPVFKIPTIQGNLTIIPDIGVFINGFLVSYLQLKLQHKGQNAREQGRGQIIGDYLESIQRGIVDVIQTNPIVYQDAKEKNNLIQTNMKYFHSPIHMVAMDTSSGYVIRGIQKYYDDIEKLYLANKANDSELKKEIFKSFFEDAVYTKEQHLLIDEKTKKVLFNLYHPNALQDEILYFNFLSYERQSVIQNGKKEVVYKTKMPVLSYPRPNQKYGVNKTIKEVVQKYKNESNPDYEIERLQKKLEALHVPEQVQKKALEKRKAYKNNRSQFSLLLQYAAGFGKTYILCWLALMLKDLNKLKNDNNKDYLFNKILIISDRVDLRDQVDRAMYNMNIEKSLFGEADNRDTLRKYLLSSSPRIIIVNIQKFPFLKDMLGDSEMSLLKDKRIAFLIDEIHRSNSGDQHHSMTNLFDEVADALSTSSKKKNLIVGLTATPTDENLARFGEYHGCLEDIKWTPFDSYTMQQAIEDGFVLDPTKSLIPFAIELQFLEEEDKKLPSSKDIYENDERLRAIAKKVAEILVTTTYKKIYGYGKAMLACYSIEAAKKYYDFIQEELDILTQNPKYANYQSSKIYMVYTNTQEHTPAYTICKFGSEKEVISAFKADKNGLMIVVDKLQTGFDEPKLHTLFLDKEVKGINAVQTVCRVNRICKNKEDTLVIDFSINNINISNIQNAFEKYAGVVVSEFDSYSMKNQCEELYKKIITTDCYLEFFEDYKNNNKDIELSIKIQQFIHNLFQNEHGKKLIIRDCETYMNYLQKLGLIDNVIGIEDKYKEKNLLYFLKDIIRLIKEMLKDNSSSKIKEVVDFWFEKLGLIGSDFIDIANPTNDQTVHEKKLKIKEKDDEKQPYSIINLIKEINAKEKEKEIFIENYIEKLQVLFEKIIEFDRSKNDGRLALKLNHINNYQDYEISEEFHKVWNMTIRRLKNDENLKLFIKEIEDNISLIEADFITYLNNL